MSIVTETSAMQFGVVPVITCQYTFLPLQNKSLYRVNSTSKYSTTDTDHRITDENYLIVTSSTPHFPNKTELDDLIRDLHLTKSGAALLTSRLRESNLLGEDCVSTARGMKNFRFISPLMVISATSKM